MKLEKNITDFMLEFSNSGEFEFSFDDSLKQDISEGHVPNEPGVYIILAILKSGQKEIIYIGKSGTMNNDGTFKPQGLAGRLTKKQEGIYRQEFFRQIIQDSSYKKLKFYWGVTIDKKRKVIPQKAEGELVQLYFDNHGKLPKYNKSY